MNRGPANRKRLLVYLFVTWLLLWSLFRMVLYPQQLTSDSILGSPRGLFVIAIASILAILWAFGGPLLLSHWQRFSSGLVNLAESSRRGSSAVWLLPAVAWFLAYSLFVIAWPLNPAMVDGPALVLALLGFVILVVLVKHKYLSDEQDELVPAEARKSRPGRLGQYWASLPAAVKHILAILLLGLVVVLWFWKALFDPDVIVYGRDLQIGFYNLEVYVSSILRSGHIPFWNPYIYSGSPLLAQSQSLVFYPPQLILRLLLPVNLSISWAIALHVWIAGVGMFALARWKGLKFWISFLCAMVYMLNSGLLLRIFAGHLWLAYAMAWLPLAWLFMMAALKNGRVYFIVAAALCLSMIILTGHPAFPIYILLFFSFYWLWACYAEWRSNRSWHAIALISGRFLAIVALAFGLSAIQLAPTLVLFSQVSISQGFSAINANYLTISLADLLALVIPNFYITGRQLGHYWELAPYVGVLFLLLVPFSYAARRADWFRDYLSASALVSMAIALGGSIGIYFVLYILLPPLRAARVPPRSLVIFIPAVTMLGGIGLQTIVEGAANAKLFSLITRAYWFASIIVLGIAAGVWLNYSDLVSIPLAESATLPVQLAIGALLFILVYAKLVDLLPATGMRAGQLFVVFAFSALGLAIGNLFAPLFESVARQLAILGILIAASSLLLTSLHYQGASPIAIFGLVVLLFFDLFISGRSYIRAEEPPVFYQNERLALKEVGFQKFDRVLSTIDEPDQYILGHVGNVDGYNSVVLSGYGQFVRGLSGAIKASSSRLLLAGSAPDPRALSFLGARYIISAEPIDNELFERIVVRDDTYVYENPEALPRAFVVHDAVQAATAQDALAVLRDAEFDYARQVVVEEPIHAGKAPDGEGTADILNYLEADGSMLVRVKTNEPGILVLSEPYYIERSAWLDGRETELLRVNLGFIGVSVPPGTHEVEIRYEPTSLYAGGVVTALSILAVVVALVYSVARKSRIGVKSSLSLFAVDCHIRHGVRPVQAEAKYTDFPHVPDCQLCRISTVK